MVKLRTVPQAAPALRPGGVTTTRGVLATLAASVSAAAAVFSTSSAAFAAAGALDPSFGTDGVVITDFKGAWDDGRAVAIQPDGKIVAAGVSNYDFALTRYHPNGSLDRRFGKVTTAVEGDGGADAVVIQPDAKIVAAGSDGRDFVLARYGPDGRLDKSFGSQGTVITDFGGISVDRANDVALQADGKVVAVGLGGRGEFALARYNGDGRLDLSFGSSGLVTTRMGCCLSEARGVAIQPDGKILAAGSGGAGFALARYNQDGSLDASFGVLGTVSTDVDLTKHDSASDVALQPDGKIVVVGVSGNKFALARYTETGTLDATFGDGLDGGFPGTVTTDFGGRASASAVAIQADGKIVAAGSGSAGITSGGFALARYDPAGVLDPTFGDQGKAITDLGGRDHGADVALQADGRIVVAGSTVTEQLSGWTADFAVVRYADT